MHLLYLITWSWSTSEVHRNPPKGKKQQNNQKERTNSTRIALHVVRRGGDHYRRFVMHSPSRIPFSGKPRKRAELRGIYPSGHSRGKSCSYSAAACDAMRCALSPSTKQRIWFGSLGLLTHHNTHTNTPPHLLLPARLFALLRLAWLVHTIFAWTPLCAGACVFVCMSVRFCALRIIFIIIYIF